MVALARRGLVPRTGSAIGQRASGAAEPSRENSGAGDEFPKHGDGCRTGMAAPVAAPSWDPRTASNTGEQVDIWLTTTKYADGVNATRGSRRR
jgi:hypothetical protein